MFHFEQQFLYKYNGLNPSVYRPIPILSEYNVDARTDGARCFELSDISLGVSSPILLFS